MSQTIASERFIGFVDNPTLKSFKKLQRTIAGNRSFDAQSSDLHSLIRLFQDGKFEEVLEQSLAMYSDWMLSPNFHYLVGNSALEVGNVETMEFSKQASRACLSCLFETGDGSLDEPYKITYRADETDILTAMSAEVRCRELVETTEGFCDVVTCHDGTEVWFDVDFLLKANSAEKSDKSESSVA